MADIKTGSSDLQDAADDGEYPFFVRSEKIERSKKYVFDCEAILVPGEGRIGEIYHYYSGKFDCHQRVYKISNFTSVDGLFILYYMECSFKTHALRNSVKATVDSIRLPTLQNYVVAVPNSRCEERDIEALFMGLDTLITLHQRESLL